VIFDMTIAVSAGIVLAALLFMRRMSDLFHADIEDPKLSLPIADPHMQGVVVYAIRGPLFFGAAEKAISTLARVSSGTRAVILQMDGVPTMDMSGLVALESAVQRLHKSRIFVAIAGVQPQPRAVLEKARIRSDPAWIAVCETNEQAIEAVRKHIGGRPV
jgi:SulP family sulfate permease